MIPKIWLDLKTPTLAVFLLEQGQSYRVMARQLGLNQTMVFSPVHMHRAIGSKANTSDGRPKATEIRWYSRTPLIRPPSESHWCGRIRGMVAREGFVYTQNAQSVTRNMVV